MTDSILRWKTIQMKIQTCGECLRIEPGLVANPLEAGEIPDPPRAIAVLFVGVRLGPAGPEISWPV